MFCVNTTQIYLWYLIVCIWNEIEPNVLIVVLRDVATAWSWLKQPRSY
jgi:hypothetical protein